MKKKNVSIILTSIQCVLMYVTIILLAMYINNNLNESTLLIMTGILVGAAVVNFVLTLINRKEFSALSCARIAFYTRLNTIVFVAVGLVIMQLEMFGNIFLAIFKQASFGASNTVTPVAYAGYFIAYFFEIMSAVKADKDGSIPRNTTAIYVIFSFIPVAGLVTTVCNLIGRKKDI